MNKQSDYQPCFANAPDAWQEKWASVREFVRRWHGLSLGPVGRISPLVHQEESRLELQLPPSFREWISFADELIAQNAFGILRDRYEITFLEAHYAISLLRQVEGDRYWAVEEDEFKDPNPPVKTYYQEFADQGFVDGGLHAACIASFVLGHMARFLRGEGGGFLVPVDPTETFIDEMSGAFPVAVRFGHLRVFEDENVISILYPEQYGVDEHQLLVEVHRPMPTARIPDCVWASAKNGGCFHGMFAERS